MAYLEKLQEEAREKVPWLPPYFTVTSIEDEQVSGWLKSDIEWEFLRHIHEKETGIHFMMRHDDRARKAKQKQRFYIKHDPIPINKHPFKLYRLITYACEYKDLGPSRHRIPDHLRKKKSKLTMVEKVNCPSKICVRKVIIYDGYLLPPKASAKKKMKLVKELKEQLEKNPDQVHKTSWTFITLPLEGSHRNHKILKHDIVKTVKDNLHEDHENSRSMDHTDLEQLTSNTTITSHGQIPTSNDFTINQEIHDLSDSKLTTGYLIPDMGKPGQMYIQQDPNTQYKSRTSNITWLGYESDVEAAVATVVRHENPNALENVSVVETQFHPSDPHTHTVSTLTALPVDGITNQHLLDQKVISVTLKDLKQEHSHQLRTDHVNQKSLDLEVNDIVACSIGMGNQIAKIESESDLQSIVQSNPKSITSPQYNSKAARMQNMQATKNRLYNDLCTMNISTLIDTLKKFNEIMPDCADEKIVETIAGMRKTVENMYESYKHDLIHKTKPKLQDDNYPKQSENSCQRKRKNASKRSTIELDCAIAEIIEEGRPVKKRKKCHIIDTNSVHTLLPAAVIQHEPLPHERQENLIQNHHHHHQNTGEHLHPGSVTTLTTATIPVSSLPTPAHQNYQMHNSNFHSNMMNVWIQHP